MLGFLFVAGLDREVIAAWIKVAGLIVVGEGWKVIVVVVQCLNT